MSYTPRHLREQILAGRSSMVGERKQVTVLFCDIVRSSALAELGAEALHAVINRFFSVALEQVHRYEGTINQFLGDGFMALFGAPIAHEDHARRAVHAALGILEGSELPLRIGINGGSVVVGAIGDDLRMDYTAFGETTILAARLQAAAAAGEVLLSEATADAVRGYFTFTRAEPVQVKERTVRPVRVTGLGPKHSPLHDTEGLGPFLGRDHELAALGDALTAAAEGQGQVVGLVGDPGMGKSRLAFEFGRAAEQRATVLEGRCLSYGTGIPYVPLLDLVRHACGIGPLDPPDAMATKLRITLDALGVDVEHGPFLLDALGFDTADSPLAALDAPTIKGRTFTALSQLLLAETRRRPVVLVVEDVHWIDKTSEEFLTELVDELASAPALLVTTCRSGYGGPPWIGKSFATQIALRPLSAAASQQVVGWILADAGASLAASIVARGEGNPFFLEELAHAAQEEVGATSAGAVPKTVLDVLAARIDRLGSEQKNVLQVASVLGREFSLGLLDQVWDGGGGVVPALQELKRLEFIRERHDEGERAFTFKHALTCDAAYEGLLESRRRALHGRAGHAIEQTYADRLAEQCEVLAHHYALSDELDRAADYLILANRKAAARHAMDEAIGYCYDALGVLDKLPDTPENRRRRLALVFDQTREFHWSHRNQEYYDLLISHQAQALELGDDDLLGRFYARLGHRQLIFGDEETSVETFHKALELCDRAGNAEDAASACAFLAWSHHMLGQYEQAVRAHEWALERLAVSYHPVWHMYAQSGVALAHMMAGRWDDGLSEVDRGIQAGMDRSETGLESFCRAIGAFVCLDQRDWQRALDYGNSGFTVGPTIYFRNLAQALLSAALCRSGALDQGLPVLEQIVPAVRASKHELEWLYLSRHLAEAYIGAGDLPRAKALLADTHESALRSKSPYFLGSSARALGEVALTEGRPTEAAEHLREAISVLRPSGTENELALSIGALGRAQRLLGDEAAAEASLREALEILDRLGTLREPERLRGLIAAGSA